MELFLIEKLIWNFINILAKGSSKFGVPQIYTVFQTEGMQWNFGDDGNTDRKDIISSHDTVLQVINLDGVHWVIVAILVQDNLAYIFDSLNSDLSSRRLEIK